MIDGVSGMSSLIGSMNTEAMQEHRAQMFARVDQNGDGGVDKSEMQAFADHTAEKTGEEINVEDLIAQFDEDGDGVLSQDEMDTAMASLGKNSGRSSGADMDGRMAEALFSLGQSLAGSESALLSALSEEPAGGPSGMMPPGPPSTEEMFNRVDEDGDGGIDKSEMQTFAERASEMTGEEVDADDLFDQFDEDGDGILNAEEAEAAFSQVREDTKDSFGPMMSRGISAYQSVSNSVESTLLSALTEDSEGDVESTLLSMLTGNTENNESYNGFETLA